MEVTVYEKLFGTPERAAETIDKACGKYWAMTKSCFYCPVWNPTCDGVCDGSVLEWLKSEEES